MTRLLAVSDVVDDSLDAKRLQELAPDAIVACGDLPFDYLEYLITLTNRPLLFVPGNHDPDLQGRPLEVDVFRLLEVGTAGPRRERGPRGAINVDATIADVGGVSVAGLGGSRRYSRGPNQYTETQMNRRALKLELVARLRRLRGRPPPHVLITHTPPLDCGDLDDVAHRGFSAFRRLALRLRPKVLIHGHVHARGRPELQLGDTRVVNAVGYRLLEV